MSLQIIHQPPLSEHGANFSGFVGISCGDDQMFHAALVA
jgi:hypothetical protein